MRLNQRDTLNYSEFKHHLNVTFFTDCPEEAQQILEDFQVYLANRSKVCCVKTRLHTTRNDFLGKGEQLMNSLGIQN